MTEHLDRIQRWRLILGKAAENGLAQAGGCGGPILDRELTTLDDAMGMIYDQEDQRPGEIGKRSAGLGSSAPRLAKWLGDIRTYFPNDVVAVIQQDAIERKGLKQLLFEPETLSQVTPSIELVGTLMSLKGLIPDQTKETARQVVRAVVDEITKLIASSIESAVKGALDRSRHTTLPSLPNLDWKRTIGSNLRNWDKDRRTIIPSRFHFWARQRRRQEWNVIVCMDQSGSMAESVVYGAVTGSILASMPALETHMVVFNDQVVDLTEQVTDPVDLLFGVQLGGGTDINQAVGYCQGLVHDPDKTLFILITDLYEGGNRSELVRRMEDLIDSGVRVMVMLALSDSGVPTYDEGLAKTLRNLDIPCFGCTPGLLPEFLAGALKGADLMQLAQRLVKP